LAEQLALLFSKERSKTAKQNQSERRRSKGRKKFKYGPGVGEDTERIKPEIRDQTISM